MNKIAVIIVSIFLALSLCLILKFFVFKSEVSSPKQFILTYKINAGIPFRWEYEIEDNSIIRFVNSYVLKDENKGALVGAPVYTNYVFEGIKEGTTVITFKYVNFVDNYVSSTEKHIVKVDKDLNVSEVFIDE